MLVVEENEELAKLLAKPRYGRLAREHPLEFYPTFFKPRSASSFAVKGRFFFPWGPRKWGEGIRRTTVIVGADGRIKKVFDTLERIKQLDKERSSLLDTAKKTALVAANQAITALNALGFNYRLISASAKTASTKRKSDSRKGTRRVKDAPCPICKFKTAPPHDARKHRFAQTP